MTPAPAKLIAGSAAIDISPADSQFLYGYPHVERMSTGVHDPLFASALYLSDGSEAALFIATDAIIAPGDLVQRARRRIAGATGMTGKHIMVTASHTHSGPVTQKMVSNVNDPIVPDPDPAYMKLYEDGVVEAGINAYKNAQPALAGIGLADGTGLGTNRHDPAGPAIPNTPVLSVRSASDNKPLAVMIVCNMHPTVLHEDSTVVSGDFPGLARVYLQKNVVGADCPIVYHMGSAGNQSPRHVTKANTMEEATRLGELLGTRVEALLDSIEYRSDLEIACDSVAIELPAREYPTIEQAQAIRDATHARFETLKKENAPRTEVRTAECDCFGADETLTLSQCAVDGRLDAAIASCQPAEVQVIGVGAWRFIGWPGEIFVEFALQVMDRVENTCLITLANNSLHGYVVTQEAIDNKYYEAGNSIFKSPDTGNLFVEHTLKLLKQTATT